jgi:hypothetical protein
MQAKEEEEKRWQIQNIDLAFKKQQIISIKEFPTSLQ